MKIRCLLLMLLVGLALNNLVTASAAPIPTIISFTSSLDSITVDEAEAGQTTSVLAWHTAGVTADYRLDLQVYRLNSWQPVYDANSVPLETNGSRTVTIYHPLNFGPPTYLLSIVDKHSRIVDQRTLSIPYRMPEPIPAETLPLAEATAEAEEDTTLTTIETFSIGQDAMDANALAQGVAQVQVSWTIFNRTPTSNLVFEQIFTDGSAVSVELPRDNLWIQSAGQGYVAPVYRDSETTVTLRLRVVDLVTSETLAEAEDTLEVVGTPSQVYPTAAPAVPAATQAAYNPPPVVPAQIVSFSGTPNTVTPGAAVTLSWEIRGTGGIYIEQAIPGLIGSQVVVSAQAPTGSTVVYVPQNAAYSILYTLYTANGSEGKAIEIKIHCPSTFFFGAGNGCPQSAVVEMAAAYQPFEGGFMIWRSDTGEIDVFYNSGATAEYYPEPSYGGLPDNPGTLTPPLNRVAPISGFGKVWANMPSVQSRIGWGMVSEQPYTMRYQPVAQPAPQFSFYFTLPDGKIVGTGFGQWQIIQ